MGLHVYGRRALRRFERETGEQIVHAVGPYVTTVDHRHLGWNGAKWVDMAIFAPQWPHNDPCRLPVRLSSCTTLFGDLSGGCGQHFHSGLMRGPCRECGVGCGQLHLWDCARLDTLLGWVNPDYWPRPVHRPRWLDDPRCPSSHAALTLRLAWEMDVPVEALLTGAPRHHWAHWERLQAEQLRRAGNAAIAQVAPQILRDAGVDPERYRVVYELESP